MDKIAIINSVLDYGSTGKLARGLYEYARSIGYEAYVFYGRGEKKDDEHLIRIDSTIEFYAHKALTLLSGYQGAFSHAATRKLLSHLRREGIRKVILLNLHGYYLNEKLLFRYLKENDIRTVYVTPDEYAAMGKCCYSEECEQYKTACKSCPHVRDYPKSLFFDRAAEIFRMKQEAYKDFDKLLFLGPAYSLEKFRASALLHDKNLLEINEGVDLKQYFYERDESLYEKYGIPRDKILILSIAKYSEPRKGVKDYYFPAARRLVNSDYHFIHIGFDADPADEDIPPNMTVIGYLDDQDELRRLCSLADLYVLASTSDTMPLSCMIALACQTPICCFYTSGMRFLAQRESPVVHYCDEISVSALAETIASVSRKDQQTMAACRALAEDKYSDADYQRRVLACFDPIIK